MTTSDAFTGTLVLFIGLILLLFLQIKILWHKSTIREYAKEHGWEIIDLVWTPSPFDRSNSTYDICYKDVSGNTHLRSAKISTWNGLWFTETQILAHKNPIVEPDTNLTKEQLIAANKQLQKTILDLQTQVKELAHKLRQQ